MGVSILSIVALLAGLIFVHELGHFVVAKAFGVKVLKFSLGFGPRLFSFRRGETEYVLALLPFGGYVKMAGEDPTQEMAPEDRGRGFNEQGPLKVSLIALAGPGFNLIFPVLLSFIVFAMPTETYTNVVGTVAPGRAAAVAGIVPGDRIVEVDGEPVRNFTELRDAVSPIIERRVPVVVERGGARVTLSVVPERLEEKNPVETRSRGIIGVEPLHRAPIVGVAVPSSPAARAGLRTFDRVTRVDGREVGTYEEVTAALKDAETRAVAVRVLRGAPLAAPGLPGLPGLEIARPAEITMGPCGGPCGVEPAEMYVHDVAAGSPAAAAGLKRGDKLTAVNGAPVEAWSAFDAVRQRDVNAELALDLLRDGKPLRVALKQRVVTVRDEFKQEYTQVLFGAYNDGSSSTRVDAEHVTHRYPLAKAFALSLAELWNSVRVTALGLYMLVTGQLSFDTVGGPLMLFDIASRSAEAGWRAFLSVLGLISVNLGIFNLVPLPVLDGFHVLSAGVEAVRKRPLSLRAREIANLVGLFLLLTLMVLATRNDIVKKLFTD